MSESQGNSETKSNPRGPFPRKGFQIMGLGLQDLIRYFFGGNAGLAIVMLILICVFLAVEAIYFFPQHHHEYRIYRQAGQEYVDLIGAEIDEHTRLGGTVNVAYLAEVNESSKREDQLVNALLQVKTAVRNRAGRTGERLEEVRESIEDLTEEIAEEEDAAKRAEAEAKLADLQRRDAELAAEWQKGAEASLQDKLVWELERNPISLSKEEKEKVREATLMAEPERDEEHPFFVALKEESQAKKTAARAANEAFKEQVDALRDAIKPLREIHSDLREVAMENRRVLDKFETAPARRAALLAGANETSDPEEKARKLRMADEVVVEKPDYEALNKPIYASVPAHQEVTPALVAAVKSAWEALPEPMELETKSGREKMRAAKDYYGKFLDTVAHSTERVPEWRHDKSMSLIKTVLAFFVGKDWVTNSSWHEFYGLMPLFMGSLLISVIAILVSVPFSVAAAVYVNQLARAKEQNFIKPAIEFIQAIPSVVLGFFGILVLGTALRELSQVEWLSWVPGFPMTERLNMLTAGLLLAFMAVPTIFTLAEDALNNVPRAFSEASLALGASRLQTIFRVIMPTAISGIIAAVLLGFGRIIGETMVVLLVAGNKIQIPDFTAGIGVFTQPAHTMTGIIAQELGEVDRGSLHWRALFMVGMVLFAISLSINFFAQRILKKFHHAH